MTPGDSVLLSMENMNLHMPSLQFGRNFHFNVILKNPNNSEWNSVNCDPTKRVDIMIQFFSGLKQFKITQQQGLGVNNSCFISLKHFPCAMLGDNCPSKILVGWAGSK